MQNTFTLSEFTSSHSLDGVWNSQTKVVAPSQNISKVVLKFTGQIAFLGYKAFMDAINHPSLDIVMFLGLDSMDSVYIDNIGLQEI